MSGITDGDWSTAVLDLGVWHSTVCEEGFIRFMAAWAREGENASNVEVAPEVPAGSLRRFRVALIGQIQGLPKRRRLRR